MNDNDADVYHALTVADDTVSRKVVHRQVTQDHPQHVSSMDELKQLMSTDEFTTRFEDAAGDATYTLRYFLHQVSAS